jgi:hypothetical protein
VTLADLPKGDEDEGIEVIDIIEAIVDNGNITRVVNAPNHGTIPNVPCSCEILPTFHDFPITSPNPGMRPVSLLRAIAPASHMASSSPSLPLPG